VFFAATNVEAYKQGYRPGVNIVGVLESLATAQQQFRRRDDVTGFGFSSVYISDWTVALNSPNNIRRFIDFTTGVYLRKIHSATLLLLTSELMVRVMDSPDDLDQDMLFEIAENSKMEATKAEVRNVRRMRHLSALEMEIRGQSPADWDVNENLVENSGNDIEFQHAVLRHLLDSDNDSEDELPYGTPEERVAHFRGLVGAGRLELLALMKSFIEERAEELGYPEFYEGALFLPAVELKMTMAASISAHLTDLAPEDVVVGGVLLVGKRVSIFFTIQQHKCSNKCGGDAAEGSQSTSSEGPGACYHSGSFELEGFTLDWPLRFGIVESTVRKCPFLEGDMYIVPEDHSSGARDSTGQPVRIVKKVRHVRGTRVIVPVYAH
jgi:hypothetical protein